MRETRFALTMQPRDTTLSKKFSLVREKRGFWSVRYIAEYTSTSVVPWEEGGRTLQSLGKGKMIPRGVLPVRYKFIRMNILYNPPGVVGIYFAVYTREFGTTDARACEF